MGKGRARKELDQSTYANRLALRVRALMDENGETPESLREQLAKNGFEVALSTVKAWLSGRNKVDLNAIPSLAKSLGVKPGELIPKK